MNNNNNKFNKGGVDKFLKGKTPTSTKTTVKTEKKANTKAITIGVRIEAELMEKIEAKMNNYPFKPSVTQVVKAALEMWLKAKD